MSLLVVKGLGLITVQDLGRRGHMHEALPPGGALVPSMLVHANRVVGNPDGAAGIEICGQLVVRALERNTIAIAGSQEDASDRVLLEVGEELAIASEGQRVAYLAIRGGVDQPVVLGGRGAHLSAGIGSLVRTGDRIAIDHAMGIGSPVRTGDRIAIDHAMSIGSPVRTGNRIAIDRAMSAGAPIARDGLARAHDALARDGLARAHDALARDHGARGTSDALDAVVGGVREVRLVPGPDLDAFASGALDTLVGIAWRISPSSDRVGTRLEGGVLGRRTDYVEQSRPMVIGAIEVPRDGAPIVLGPEHPTTGGYPVIAVVASDSRDAFHSIPLGGSVRFRV